MSPYTERGGILISSLYNSDEFKVVLILNKAVARWYQRTDWDQFKEQY
jgi:hypothetical protein